MEPFFCNDFLTYYLSGKDYRSIQEQYLESEDGSKEEKELLEQMKKDGKLLWSEK